MRHHLLPTLHGIRRCSLLLTILEKKIGEEIVGSIAFVMVPSSLSALWTQSQASASAIMCPPVKGNDGAAPCWLPPSWRKKLTQKITPPSWTCRLIKRSGRRQANEQYCLRHAAQGTCYLCASGDRNRAYELLKETCIECCSCSESASAAGSWVVLVHCPRHGETEKSSAAQVSMKLRY